MIQGGISALGTRDRQFHISPHFTLAELTVSTVAEKYRIDNWPRPRAQPAPIGDVLRNLEGLCENVLEPIRARYGRYSPTSVFRCTELNVHPEVGGNPGSQHLVGQAADFRLDGIPNDILAAWIAESIQFDQLILEHFTRGRSGSGWVHVSWCPGHLRGEVLTVTLANQTLAGLHGG